MCLGESVFELPVKNPILEGILVIFVGVIRNIIVPSNRARRVILGTKMKHFEHVSRRICVELLESRDNFLHSYSINNWLVFI